MRQEFFLKEEASFLNKFEDAIMKALKSVDLETELGFRLLADLSKENEPCPEEGWDEGCHAKAKAMDNKRWAVKPRHDDEMEGGYHPSTPRDVGWLDCWERVMRCLPSMANEIHCCVALPIRGRYLAVPGKHCHCPTKRRPASRHVARRFVCYDRMDNTNYSKTIFQTILKRIV